MMNGLESIFRKFSADNHFVALAKSLNSAKTSRDTRETMKPLTEAKKNQMAHNAFLYIHKETCYVSYIHNYGATHDDPFCRTMVLELAIFPLARALCEDFDYKTDVRVLTFDGNREIIGEINATCSFLCNSICAIGDDLHLTFGGQVDGDRFVLFHTVYDTEKQTFSTARAVKISYKGELYPLDDRSINRITTAEGYPADVRNLPMTTASWYAYEGYYYTTFMLDGPHGRPLLIRTRDFDVMEFVCMVPDAGDASGEIACCIHENFLYTACRQTWTVPYLLMNRYDLETGEWNESYPIEDGTSRPWFFLHNDGVYLFNTIEERDRRFASISRVRTDRRSFSKKAFPIDTAATLYGCGSYHSFFVYGGRVFFACTYKRTVQFGELLLTEYDPEQVNEKLLSLLGE